MKSVIKLLLSEIEYCSFQYGYFDETQCVYDLRSKIIIFHFMQPLMFKIIKCILYFVGIQR